MTQPYFLTRARLVFAHNGGAAANAGELAQWAQNMRESGEYKERPYAILAVDGTLLATASRRGRNPSGYYIDRTDKTAEWSVADQALDMSLGKIKRAVGQDVVAINAGDVCMGAGQPEYGPVVEAAMKAEEAEKTFDAAQAELQAAVTKVASREGANLRELSIIAGVTRQTVYTWKKQAEKKKPRESGEE